MYSEKPTKFCEIFPLLLTVWTVVQSKGKISQKFVAFSEYKNFKDKKAFQSGHGGQCLGMEGYCSKSGKG